MGDGPVPAVGELLEPCQAEGLDPPAQSLLHIFQTCQAARPGDILKLEVAVEGVPVDGLVLAPDEPLDFETEDFRFRLIHAKRLKRDHHLSRPTFRRACRRHRPLLIPSNINIHALIGYQGIVLSSQRVGPEQEGVTAVVEGIQQDGHAVILDQIRISAALAGNDGVRLPVLTENTKENGLPGVDHVDGRRLAAGRSLLRVLLVKIAEGSRLCPGDISQVTIQHGGLFHEGGPSLLLRGRRRLPQTRRQKQEGKPY